MRLLPGIVLDSGCGVLAAGGWPQWGAHAQLPGPDAGLAASWTDQVPKRLWKRDIGFGHSSILVERGGQRPYTMYRTARDEVVISLDANTGQTLWEFRYPAPFLSGMNMDGGVPDLMRPRLLWAGPALRDWRHGKIALPRSRTGKLRMEARSA